MLRHTIYSLARQHGGHVLDYKEDGLLVFDNRRDKLLHLPALMPGSVSERHVEQLIAFLQAASPPRTDMPEQVSEESKAPASRGKAFRGLNFHVDIKMLDTEISRDALGHLVSSIPQDVRLALAWHAPRRPAVSWKHVFGEFLTKFHDRLSSGSLALSLTAPFEPCSRDDRLFLWDHGFRLSYVHNLDSIRPGFSEEMRRSVNELAEFGFHLPFVWYVDARNVATIPSIIDEAMELNFNSGFALPPVSERPFVINGELPEIDDYIELLVTVHAGYPHYDDHFFPLNAFVSGVLPSSKAVSSQHMHLWMTPNEPIRLSGVCLENSQPWLSWQEVRALSDPCKMFPGPSSNLLCESCECRVFCPGNLSTVLDQNSRKSFYCQTAVFFLKAFAWQRWLLTKEFVDDSQNNIAGK